METKTKIGYVKRLALYNEVKPYCLNVPVFPNGRMHNIEYEYCEGITVRDIRGRESAFNLDIHGFEIAHFKTSLHPLDFEDNSVIYTRYFPESEEWLKRKLGAARVTAFEHQIRRHQEGLVDDPVAAYHQPLTGAHCDQTPESMDSRIRFHLGDEADELLKHRHQVINIWRPLNGPTRDYPLAVCEYSSIAQCDLLRSDLIFPHYEGENYLLHENPEHKWFYISDQMPWEVWLLKNQDSIRDGRATMSAHAAFPLELSSSEPIALRQSIELRCLVFYKD
jgi:hypothetical protein